MKLIKRIGVGLLVLIALIVFCLAVWEPMSVEISVAPPARDYEARIVRDGFGVPHICGKTDADVA